MNTTPEPRITKGRAAAGTGVAGIIALILATTLNLEGGYVNHKSDPGGETNHGVTVGVARERGFDGDLRDLARDCDYPIFLPRSVAKDLEESALEDLVTDNDGDVKCAAQILYEGYVEEPGYVPLIVIDPWVASEVIDTAVNMGPSRPSRFFQRGVNHVCNTTLTVDGKIGPNTVRAWKDCRDYLGPSACRRMIDELDRQQAAEYERLIRRNPKLAVFRRGWMNHRIGNVDPWRCGTEMV